MVASTPSACPRCGADRVVGPECPRCGVIYAKARPAPAAVPPPPSTELVPALDLVVGDARGLAPDQAPSVWGGDLEDARREVLVRTIAPPVALLLAWGLVATGLGHALVRLLVTMWLHELGHAVVAWWSGLGAFPGPWLTLTSNERMPVVILALAAGLAGLGGYGWRTRRRWLVAAAVSGLALQLVCTLLPLRAARALGTFGGDAGAMVLGAALVATIWTDPEGPLGRGWLRWGFLVIGACALVDAFDTWVGAYRDFGLIPLGENEGVTLSDASKLMDQHGWGPRLLTGRYVRLGLGCFAALGVGYVVGLLRARRRLRAVEDDRPGETVS